MKIIIPVLFVLASCFAHAENLGDLDNILLYPHWQGPEALIKELSKHKSNKCEYLDSRLTKFSDIRFASQRILIALKTLNCEKTALYVDKFLASKDVVLVIAAVDLGSTLSDQLKEKIKAKVVNLRKSFADDDLNRSIEAFLSSL